MNNEYFEKFGFPPFYEDERMYAMTDKRSYTAILRDLDAKMAQHILEVQYIKNHLRNMDGHLEKINTTNLKQEVKIARNKDRIGLILKVGGVLITLLGGSFAFILHLLGLY